MLSPAEVSREPDFTLGRLRVSPSARRVETDDSSLTLEPRVMQVLLLLARHRNEVVTRETLFAEVWGGAIVGDDSVNRAVAGARRAIALDPDGLALETIPRTGYLLKVAGEEASVAPPGIDRRMMLLGGAAVAGAAGAGLWFHQSREDRRFDKLIEQSENALANGDPSRNPTGLLEQAIALRPGDAMAQGLYAYSLANLASNALALQSGNRGTGAGALLAADRAVRAALAIDPNEPNARLAETFILQTSMDFAQTEDRLGAILTSAPDNIHVMKNYWNVLQCVGRSRDALAMVQRALEVAPLAASVHYPLAQLLWINGRNAEADRVIDKALQYWPGHRFVRFARFVILAFTGRPRAALAMLESRDTAPQNFSPRVVAMWRASLAALDDPTPAAVAAARDANVAAARADMGLTHHAVLALSGLGDVDAAFELTNALFVVPGSPEMAHAAASARSTAWRFAPWLFIPPTAALRADHRFGPLCDTIGLTDYWRKRGIRPDYQLV